MSIEQDAAPANQLTSNDIVIRLHLHGGDVIVFSAECLLGKMEEEELSSVGAFSRLCELAVSAKNQPHKTSGSNRFAEAVTGLGRSLASARGVSLLGLNAKKNKAVGAVTNESSNQEKDCCEVQLVYSSEEGDKIILTSDEGTMAALAWASEKASKCATSNEQIFLLDIFASIGNQSNPAELTSDGRGQQTEVHSRRLFNSPVSLQRGKEQISAATSLALDNVFSAVNSATEFWKHRQGPPEQNIQSLESIGFDRKVERGAVAVLDNFCGAFQSAKKFLRNHSPPSVTRNKSRVADSSVLEAAAILKSCPPPTNQLAPMEQISFEPEQHQRLIPKESVSEASEHPNSNNDTDDFEKVDALVSSCVLDIPGDLPPQPPKDAIKNDQLKEELGSVVVEENQEDFEQLSLQSEHDASDDETSIDGYEDIPDASSITENPTQGEDEWCVLQG